MIRRKVLTKEERANLAEDIRANTTYYPCQDNWVYKEIIDLFGGKTRYFKNPDDKIVKEYINGNNPSSFL